MPQFFIDKANRVPIYLQLKDQIKYYISTGAITAREQLTPVKILARDLGINFQTVRKAYIELEREGLIQIKHGEGTFISFDHSGLNRTRLAGNTVAGSSGGILSELGSSIEDLLENFGKLGLDMSDARVVVDDAFLRIERRKKTPKILFAECNHFQIIEISKLLEKELGLAVEPVLLSKLGGKVATNVEEGRKINVVTTGFHVNEVRMCIGDLPIEVDVLITNLNPNTRRQLEAVGENGRFSFICRDRESAVLYKDLLKAELGFENMDLTCCTIYESAKVREALNSSDVVLASPPVFNEVREMAPARKAVYNVFERVDPMSLRVLKDRLMRS